MNRWTTLVVIGIFMLAPVGQARAAGVVQVQSGDDSYSLHFESNPQGAITRARQLVAQNKLSDAISWLSRYVEIHPREIEPRRYLGDLYFQNGDVEHAISMYRAIVLMFPDDRETHDRLGVAYATQHRIDDAIQEFTKSLPSTSAIRDLVTLHRVRGDFSVFRAKMEHDAALDPLNAILRDEVGEIDLADHRNSDAKRDFAIALRDRQGFADAQNGIGRANLAEMNYIAAAHQFELCIKDHPSYYPCWVNLGAAQLHLHNLQAAQAALSRAASLDPTGPEMLVNFGYLADERGAWKSAVTYYAQAIASGPYTSAAYIDAGLDYIGHRMYGLAEAALTKGVAFTPYDGRIHVLLGDVYKVQGQATLAIEQYKIAVSSTNSLARSIAQDRLSQIAPATPSANPSP